MKNKRICALITTALLTSTSIPVFAAAASPAVISGDVTIANNYVGTKDTITLKGSDFSSGDVVNVYNSAAKTVKLGTATANGTDDVVVTVNQVGQAAGNVYITNKDAKGDLESSPVAVPFIQEETPAIDALKASVINNVDKADVVKVTGLTAGEVANVYAKDGTTKLGTGTASSTGVATITLAAQLSESDLEVEVSGVGGKAKESAKTKVTYTAQEVSADPSATVINNVDKADIVTFAGLKIGDKVTVYSKDGTTVLGSATAVVNGDLKVTLTKQLSETDLEVEATVKNLNKMVSNKKSVTYTAQEVSADPSATVTNNVDKADIVTFAGLKIGDKVTVYAKDGTTVLGSATAVVNGDLKVNLTKQLSETDLEVEATVKNLNKMVSSKKSVAYTAQEVSAAPSATVTNNVDKADTVTFAGLKKGDKAIVYAKDGTTVLGTAIAAVDGDLKVTLTKQLSETDLEIKAVVKSPNKMPNDKAVTYSAQEVSSDPSATVTNNVDKADTVTFAGLKKGDKAIVYAKDGTTILGTAIAAVDGDLTVTLAKQLSEADLEVEAAVKSPNKVVSAKKSVTYSVQAVTTKLDEKNMLITNNAIFVVGLTAGDRVSVYDSNVDGAKPIATVIVAKGNTYALIANIKGASSGKTLYVTNKTSNKMQSDKLTVTLQ